VPALAAAVVEPLLGLAADRGRRRAIVLGGGTAFAAALILLAAAPGFGLLLVGCALLYPASGGFVALAQASLVDATPGRSERSLALWTLVGSAGAIAGPFLVGFGVSWRVAFAALAGVAIVLVLALRHERFDGEAERADFGGLRHAGVLRPLVVLALQDVAVEVLFGYLALYFVDVAHASARTAAIAIVVWSCGTLAGEAIVLRLGGTRLLRATAAAFVAVFTAFQLVASLDAKLVLTGVMAALASTWYPVAQARLYDALPGKSGAAMAVSSVAGSATAVVPVLVGVVAARAGLGVAFWLLLAGPAGMLAATIERCGSRSSSSISTAPSSTPARSSSRR